MKPERWAALAALAEQQHALVTIGQAETLGVRSDARKRAMASGLLISMGRGVLRVAGSPASPWEDLMAACLVVRPAGVACRRSAGLLHGLPVADADRRRLCRPADIAVALSQITRRGRTGVAKLWDVLDHHISGSSELEGTWLRHLAAADLPAAVHQYQLVVRGRVLLLDAAWPAARVALEVDGWDAHRARDSFDTDADRGNLLVEAGWRVVHATSRSDPEVVTGQLRRLVDG